MYIYIYTPFIYGFYGKSSISSGQTLESGARVMFLGLKKRIYSK